MSDKFDEKTLVDKFNEFIKKWTGGSYPHLIDSDDNDGERFREALHSTAQEHEAIGYKRGLKEAEGLVGALDLAWRDILDWECTVKGLRAMSKNDLFISIQGTAKGEKESEKIRHKIHQTKTQFKEKMGEK